MKKLLSRFLARTEPALDEDDRVLTLFNNRAELKIARLELQDEIQALKESLEQQRAATDHVQGRLDALEARLADPRTGHHALVFHGLRDLCRAGSNHIAALILVLTQQHEARERRLFVSEHNRQQFEARQQVDDGIERAQEAMREARVRHGRLIKARGEASQWWKYFRQRELDRQLEASTAQVRQATTAFEAARQSREASLAALEPTFPGLSLEARRTVNLVAILYADRLTAALAGSPLLPLLWEAMRGREPPEGFGDKADCDALLSQIAAARSVLPRPTGVGDGIQQQAAALRQQARYARTEDAVPLPGSVPSAALREDHWALARVLLS